MPTNSSAVAAIGLAALLCTAAAVPSQTRLLRYPDIYGNRVVFTYGGDLWTADVSGGDASRLTATPGIELFAKFSPDGRWIAFTGQVGGDEQVYVIPAQGGEIRQLTWYPADGPLPARWGYDNQVYGWTPDGTAVLFRSLRAAWTLTGGRLYTVPLPAVARRRGALPTPLPMPEAGAGEFSPNGERIVYAPLFRDFRTWKRYEGGWAQELFVFDPQTKRAQNISNHPRADRDPMWIEDRVWFASDRSGTLNLWSYDFASETVNQETGSTTWDLRWPSAGGPTDHRIVYEKGGELHWLDTQSRQERKIAIRVPDDGVGQRPRLVAAQDHIEGYSLSPGGRRVAFAARGEVLTAPREHGDVRDLTRSPGAHDKHASFSPDGATVAFVSDRSGEEQIWLVDHLGAAPPRQLTEGLTGMLYEPRWSPDGRWIAFGDKDGVLRVCEVASGALQEVADEPRGQLRDHSWSPCSGHLAFSMSGSTPLPKVYIYTLADGETRCVSRPLSNDSAPVFGPRGERLFFRGLRGFQPRLPGAYEWDFQIDRGYGIYALALRADLPALFAKRSDEAVEEDVESQTPEFAGPIQIDHDGLADRVEQVPVALDNYWGLGRAGDRLIYGKRGGSYYGRGSDRPTTLHSYDLDQREETKLAEAVRGYTTSPDSAHILVQKDGEYLIADPSKPDLSGADKVDVAALQTTKVAADEHWQIFHEVWRRYRDFFYVDNMHGFDWVELREQYAPLVAHVRHRSDLNYVIGEMIAELNVGHAYITGGDLGAPARPTAALPGVVLAYDEAASRYKIADILRGENDSATYRSPASAVGVQLKKGDYLLAIDGHELQPQDNPYQHLRGKAGRTIQLTVHSQPAPSGARTVAIEPISSESDLHYHAWVERNRARVTEMSGGRLGYVHLPNMGSEGIREFLRQYYPQRDKAGLVIDDRYNGGGNVSEMVINRLSRELMMLTFGRTSGYDPYPSALFHGHMVCLLNETSASDGDIFPAMFRKAGLGKLIGKRSWGGIIGITNRGALMDGGTVNVPEFGNTDSKDAWTIEGYGVDPDIEVDNDVASVIRGEDPQLTRGVQVLLELLEADPRPLPTAPPPPVKTGR
ncbi:MAG: S41 family peptidase [Planctomycetota bacterium]|nr:S41 family peptidase [Planctomycetota bacterium]